MRPLLRRRQRFVFEADLTIPREPSQWALNETVLVIDADNLDRVNREVLASLHVEKHQRDFAGIRRGNRLFVVQDGEACLYRGYIRMIEPQSDDRKSLFFDEMERLPEIRSCETAEHARGRGLYRRVLNDQLRYLKSLGFERASLYTMAENAASIKGVTAAGFNVYRKLSDWIVFNLLVIQRVEQADSVRWRVFLL